MTYKRANWPGLVTDQIIKTKEVNNNGKRKICNPYN